MTIPSKLPRPSKSKAETFTAEEWEQYFEYRKNDHPMDFDDQIKLIRLATSAYLKGDVETYRRLGQTVPLRPDVAMAFKNVEGLKVIQDCNLYEAKQSYPDEF